MKLQSPPHYSLFITHHSSFIPLTTVFISIDWFHPAFKAGGPIQSIANLVNRYGAAEVNFRIFCSNADLDGTINEGVVFDEWCNYNSHTQVWYASKKRQSISVLKREMNKTRADVMFVIGIYSWHFNLAPLLFGRARIKIISVRGMLHPGALSQKPLKKKIYLAIWKLAGIHRRYCFHATDAQEQDYIQQVFGKQATVLIAGNYPGVLPFQQVVKKTPGELRMVSIALISPMKNIALVLEALATCKQQVMYDIYGPVKDEGYWQQCLIKIGVMPANITVRCQGVLAPAKIASTLSDYHVFILPSRSENFGHAIYEALSAGRPVITSHHTPFNGLYEQRAGRNITAENIPEISRAIAFFGDMDSTSFEKWSKGANEYSKKCIDPSQLKMQYDRLFGINFT